MDEETIVVLGIQLLALACIAAALVVYLVCKVNRRKYVYRYEGSGCAEYATINVGTGRSILLTSCETIFGIQLALHLTSLGFRVFAGFKPTNDYRHPSSLPDGDDQIQNQLHRQQPKYVPCPSSESMKILKAKLKQREAMSNALIGAENVIGLAEEYVLRTCTYGNLITVPLDVTREDSLHEALEYVRRHLPAGEDGLWAVVNTAGICFKGKLEQQDSSQWETMFKVNVFGMLRAARTFMPLLKAKKGRVITIGTGNDYKFGISDEVVFNAARYAVAGASCSLNREMAAHDVRVITIHTESIPSDKLFTLPKIPRNKDDGMKDLPNDRYVKYSVAVVPNYAMNIIEEALLVTNPKEDYYMAKPTGFTNYISAFTEKLEDSFVRKKTYNVERTV